NQNGPGGDLPALFLTPGATRPVVLCAQAPSPATVSIEAFTELGLDEIPANGLLPLVVPGAFDGWMILLKDYGTMTLRDVLEPAIYYAENGFPVLPELELEADSVRE